MQEIAQEEQRTDASATLGNPLSNRDLIVPYQLGVRSAIWRGEESH